MQVFTPNEYNERDASVLKAAYILQQGGVIAFPTETVYGLGACFDNVEAINKIFKAKQRPADNPLIVHVAGCQELELVAASVPPLAERLMLAFWPGPLTIVLPKTDAVPLIATGGLDTVGVRMPAHPLALALINAVGKPLFAPSANLSTRPSPTTAQHVVEDLQGRIDAVLDGGATEVGLESTVIRLVNNSIQILRPGGVTREMLEDVGRVAVTSAVGHSTQVPPSPGMKYMHYSPKAKVSLFMGQAVVELPAVVSNMVQQGIKPAVLAFSDTLEKLPEDIVRMPLGERGSNDTAAKMLYAYLREADILGVQHILVEGLKSQGLGEAVMNRLLKAASEVRGN